MTEHPDLELAVRGGPWNSGEAMVTLERAARGRGRGMVAGDVVNTAARRAATCARRRHRRRRGHVPSDAKALRIRAPRAGLPRRARAKRSQLWQPQPHRAGRFGVERNEPIVQTPLIGRDDDLGAAGSPRTRARVAGGCLDPAADDHRRAGRRQDAAGRQSFGRWGWTTSPRSSSGGRGARLPYGEGITYWALGEMIKAQAGILEIGQPRGCRCEAGESPSAKSRKTRPRSTGSRRLSAPLVGEASGTVTSSERGREIVHGVASLRRGASLHSDRSFSSSRTCTGPTRALLAFIEGISWSWSTGVAPPRALYKHGPSSTNVDAGWGGGKRNSNNGLAGRHSRPTTPRACSRALLHKAVPTCRAHRSGLLEQAGGNPLYAEEFVRMHERGRRASTALPDSVLGIVTARVDLLPPAEKELLRDAAVMGRRRLVGRARAVSGSTRVTDGRRGRSARSAARSSSGASGGRPCRGRDRSTPSCTRSSATPSTAQLPRADRVERHVRVARWIESLPDDRREDRAELLAHHYLEAIELVAQRWTRRQANSCPAATAALREAGHASVRDRRVPAGGSRTASAADSWLAAGPRRRARSVVLGKALVFTEQRGCRGRAPRVRPVARVGRRARRRAVAAIDLAYSHWQHGDGRRRGDVDRPRRSSSSRAPPPSYEHAHVVAQVARFEMLAGQPGPGARATRTARSSSPP